MANRTTRAVDDARRQWHRRRIELSAELRSQRIVNGASQADVAGAIGCSASEVSRRERGEAPNVSALSLAEHAAAVGLRLVLTMYPAGGAVRDAAQIRVIHRFLARVSDRFVRELEAVIPLPGDLRAVDLVLRMPAA